MIESMRKVEIEIQSFCNRKCEFCPNKDFNRDMHEEMSEETFIKLFDNLKEQNFGQMFDGGVVSFTRYSEAMSKPELFKKRVAQAKKRLPFAQFTANTNGDFLSKENLDGLELDHLAIMDYDCLGYEECTKKLEDIGINIIDIIPDQQTIMGVHDNGMIVAYSVNWTKNATLEDRGGYFKQGEEITHVLDNGEEIKMVWRRDRRLRSYPCNEPLTFIAIDYAGYVTPCCHIREDNPEHKKYVLGNINESSIVEIMNSDKTKDFAKRASSIGSISQEEVPEPCKYCQKAGCQIQYID